jgi:hypothetical protein
MVITCAAYFTVILNFEMPVISDTHQTFCVHSFVVVTLYTPKLLNTKCVFCLLCSFCLNIFQSQKNSVRCCHECAQFLV